MAPIQLKKVVNRGTFIGRELSLHRMVTYCNMVFTAYAIQNLVVYIKTPMDGYACFSGRRYLRAYLRFKGLKDAIRDSDWNATHHGHKYIALSMTPP